jgi:hypothetical protein
VPDKALIVQDIPAQTGLFSVAPVKIGGGDQLAFRVGE